jgi:Fur family transcriptional regulator, ferric uptake regulator
MTSKPDLEELRSALRDRGLRATSSRLAVLQHMRTAKQPLSHADVVAQLAPGPWDPATIYRNLLDLVEVGLARRTDVGDHVWRFEVVVAGHREDHPHFVCKECGVVECLPDVELLVPRTKAPRSVKKRQVELQLRGLCDTCT